jgi:hypothetical protein
MYWCLLTCIVVNTGQNVCSTSIVFQGLLEVCPYQDGKFACIPGLLNSIVIAN